MQIKIIDATVLENYDLLNDLQKECLPHDDLYNVLDGWWWIAYDNDLPIGFSGLVRSKRWSDTGYFCRAGVVKRYRGKGIQKDLIRVRERKARKLGFNWIITDTTDNPPSSNSLISCGYKLFNPSIPWGGRRTLYWRKRL